MSIRSLEKIRRGLHHTIVVQSVRGHVSLNVPVLYLEESDGSGQQILRPLHVLTDYFIDHSAMSLGWMRLRARGIGLLYDYIRQRRAFFEAQATEPFTNPHRVALTEFQNHLLRGTIVKGVDETGLYWLPRKSPDIVVDLCSAINDVLGWIHANQYWSRADSPSTDFLIPSSGRELLHLLYVARYRKELSFLAHIKQSKRQRPVVNRNIVGRDTRDFHRASDTVRFPLRYLIPLLEQGFVTRPNAEKSWEREDLTAKLASMLCAFGGLRRSEPLHLWLDDVQRVDGQTVVFLQHPCLATVTHEIHGEMPRSDLLQKDCEMSARNLAAGRFHAGWKGIKCNAEWWTPVYFLPFDGVDDYFWNTYQTYKRIVRPRLMQKRVESGLKPHPFLFVSSGESYQEDDDTPVGAPYTYAAHGGAWERAIKRLASIYPDDKTLVLCKEFGTTLHGLRHMYGGMLAVMGLDEKMIQECMHHLSPLSQQTYTKPRNEAIDHELREGVQRIRALLDGKSMPEPSRTPTSAFRDLGTMLEDIRRAASGRGF